MIFFISYDYKALPINLHFLNIGRVRPLHFILTWKKHFSTSSKSVTDKVTKCAQKSGTKSSVTLQIPISIKTLLFHFFVIWSPVKYKDFLIISNLSQIFHILILLYKDKLKVQHKSATSLLCTNMLCFYAALFLGMS